MNNNLFSTPLKFKRGKATDQQKIGGIHKTHKIIATNEAREQIENMFMNIAFKNNRSDKQRADRINKR